MKIKSDSVTIERPPPAHRRDSGGNVASTVFGFPVEENQFSALQSNQSAASQLSTEREEGLVDPRTTRHLRWATRRAALRIEGQGTKTKQVVSAIVPTLSSAQGNLSSGNMCEPCCN